MSSSSASSKSTNSSVSNTDPANTSPDDREESSNESDDEGNSVVKSPGEKAAIDDIWFQVLWILKLGSDDIEYLQAEVGKLLGTSPHWHETVFSIPTKGKEGRRMISLRKCKARLRNHVAVYNMVAAAEALRNADDDTLQCLFENRLEPLEWVREWLELSDLVFRRIVDADSQKRGVGKEEDTRQIFKKIFDEKKVFRTPKEPSYSGIDEYKHRSQGHKITKNKKKVIDEWRYPGWLKGKWPPHRLFHEMLNEPEHKSSREEAIRKLEDGKILGDLAGKRELLKDLQMREYQKRREIYVRMEAERKVGKRKIRGERRKEKEEREKKRAARKQK